MMMATMTMKHVTHEHHILWSASLSVLSHGAYLYRICIVFLFLYIVLCGVSHECICGNNHNQVDFPNPVIMMRIVVTGIKIMMVRVEIIMSTFVSMLVIMMATMALNIFFRYNICNWQHYYNVISDDLAGNLFDFWNKSEADGDNSSAAGVWPQKRAIWSRQPLVAVSTICLRTHSPIGLMRLQFILSGCNLFDARAIYEDKSCSVLPPTLATTASCLMLWYLKNPSFQAMITVIAIMMLPNTQVPEPS